MHPNYNSRLVNWKQKDAGERDKTLTPGILILKNILNLNPVFYEATSGDSISLSHSEDITSSFLIKFPEVVIL